MSASSGEDISDLFRRIEPPARAGQSRRERVDDLIAVHEEVARLYAESAYMLLTSEPAYVECKLSRDELLQRMQADFDALVTAATDFREQRGTNDDVTRLLAKSALTLAYHERYNALCLQACLTPTGGRA